MKLYQFITSYLDEAKQALVLGLKSLLVKEVC